MKTTRPDWYEDGKINLIAQFSFKPHPDLPNVPVMMDLVEKPEDKQALELIFATQEMGRPFAAPPGIPADRAAALRKAFEAAIKDPALLADAKKQDLEIDTISGQEITDLLVKLYDTPKDVVARVEGFRTGAAGETDIKAKK